jgi:hypothetical protein
MFMRRLTAAQSLDRVRRGERIAHALHFADNMSQAQLAKQLKTTTITGKKRSVSQAYVGQLVMGERPGNLAQWKQIAAITGVPASYIISGTGWSPPPRATSSSATPDKTVVLPVDPELMSTFRGRARVAYRLSTAAARVMAKLVNSDVERQGFDPREPMVLVVMDGNE